MEKRDVGIAYLLLLFFGAFGAHRYYLGRHNSAVWMTGLSLSIVGLLVTGPWAVIDLFRTARFAREYNAGVMSRRLRDDAAWGVELPHEEPRASLFEQPQTPKASAFAPPSTGRRVENTPDVGGWPARDVQTKEVTTGGKHRAS